MAKITMSKTICDFCKDEVDINRICNPNQIKKVSLIKRDNQSVLDYDEICDTCAGEIMKKIKSLIKSNRSPESYWR